jgi:predicted transcriptional regulator
MSTTSLKLPEELKERAAAAADKLGVSPHAFMVDAIASATDQAERRAEFVAEALAVDETMTRTGLGYDADEVHRYLRQRAAGKRAVRPKARSWRD